MPVFPSLFLRRSGTVGNITPETATEQIILEIATGSSRNRQSQLQHYVLPASHPTELSVACLGLFGQVINIVASHIPKVKLFNVLRSNTEIQHTVAAHTQWTALILIWKPLNAIFVEYFKREN